MFNQDFQLLNRNDLDVQLSTIFRHWDATPLERAEFVGWAWIVAAASDLTASEDRGQAVLQLKHERDLLHQDVARQAVATAHVDLALTSKRMFLDWLQSQLAQGRVAA